MRINQFVAQATGLSRRAADQAILDGRVYVNGHRAELGQPITDTDQITLDNRPVNSAAKIQTIMLNKPVGYVVSRDGQGSKTIYDLLPAQLHHLKPVGRLDKESSGLLLITSDGKLAQQLTHPSFEKEKVYEVRLNRELTTEDFQHITLRGVELKDILSRFRLGPLNDSRLDWKVTMAEGRNRQIRRTFAALGYTVTKLHRTQFGPYEMGELPINQFKSL